MSFTTRPGARIACALTLLLSAITPVGTQADGRPDPLAWRDAATTTDLVAHLDTWIDTRTALPRRTERPQIRLIGETQARNLSARHASRHGGRARGFYDPDQQTVYLVRPWDPRDPFDVSVLLHELIHHRQAEAGHWYCPAAQELPAYRLQDAWLGDLGLKADVNWIAVVLDSGCPRRDIHPD
ncbi:hypothetical protein KZZ07_25035 [Mameliella sp. CS4]|uniref:DUF6647 family protein n=1 Tax=Mameliella sp. CS4 TaxID=2862329 RepID=UPI001C5F3A57|nr:DUF6647 family protein [Mameliella sp. CS4]MBW4985812.1 hypothetical protein [Mameliella sp. CS4]